MFIVINCLGMPFNGNTINEKSLGGSETAAYYIAEAFGKKGHKVTCFTNSRDETNSENVRYLYAGEQGEGCPLGANFHFYAENTPHDVLIIQRHPGAFDFNYASKINLWWTHDLGLIRQKGVLDQSLYNIDGVLTVSHYHKDQMCEVYKLNPDIVYPITNGIDLDLINTVEEREEIKKKKTLLYSSRPERGLEHLVMPGGIMERLGNDYHLLVCGYDNTTQQMANYYEYLAGLCNDLPNVTNIGALTKKDLYSVMKGCHALVYPTPSEIQPNFTEVSCITAMECMGAGLPLITSEHGALPETCKESGSVLIPLKEGLPDHDGFVEAIKTLDYDGLRKKQLESAPKFDWAEPAEQIINICNSIFEKRSPESIVKRYIKDSDIHALRKITHSDNKIAEKQQSEIDTCYSFEKDIYNHYQAYYEYEKQRGVDYGPENLSNNSRFECVAGVIDNLPDQSVILDYGCAHGHYTNNLAKRYPNKRFIGIDITESNIEKARAWAEPNAEFIHGYIENGEIKGFDALADCIIAAEVIEHVSDYNEIIDTLSNYLNEDGLMVITTPFGPWEAQGYRQHWPWRAHLHHFERQDWHDIAGHFPGFNMTCIPGGNTKEGDLLGSYMVTFRKPDTPSIKLDYSKKAVKGCDTLSVCMIVKNAEDTILNTLKSVEGVADEIIIRIDKTTDDKTREIIKEFNKPWLSITVFEGDSPLSVGFDAARNETLDMACGDWILWIDADEVLINPNNLAYYLRNNQYSGYAVQQHHISAEPAGLLKTDLPCRLFRNGKGIKFFGLVHEHPETEINKGVGHVMVLPDVSILHNGYTTEEIRRGRFKRNIGLLQKDREIYPERVLGKFLWLRDLAQMSQYEMEMNGGHLTKEIISRANEGIEIWRWLVENNLRMAVDGLGFYSTLCEFKGGGFSCSFSLGISKTGRPEKKEMEATFDRKEDLKLLLASIVDDRTKDFNSIYYG